MYSDRFELMYTCIVADEFGFMKGGVISISNCMECQMSPVTIFRGMALSYLTGLGDRDVMTVIFSRI